MMEWLPIISTLSAVSPVLFMVLAYIKTWSKFEITVSNLSESVNKLSMLLESARSKLIDHGERLSRVEATVQELLAREHLRANDKGDSR